MCFRQVLLYLFYGHFTLKRTPRLYPVIRAIHLQTTNGRRRFASFADECFHVLFKLLKDESNLSHLLTDYKRKAPARYLTAVEQGFREMAKKSVHTMGGGALQSQERWSKVLQWRKREERIRILLKNVLVCDHTHVLVFNNYVYLFVQAYIAAVRTFFNRPNLRKWKVFLWNDFLERQQARVAFEKRHLPLSDGKHHDEFEGMVPVPEIWSRETPDRPIRGKHVKRPSKRNATHTTSAQDAVVMVYDADTNKLVPLISIE